MMAAHLEFYHVGFRHCHLGFRHLLIFSQIHSKTLSLHSDSWLKLIQSDSNLFILTQLDDGTHLEFGHLGFSHLSFSSQTCSHLPGLLSIIWTKKPPLIHSDSTWWWQPSWILPCWNQTLPCWIQTPSYLLSDSPKNNLPPLWFKTNSIWLTWWWLPSWILPSWIQPFCTKLWVKLIQSDSNSFILTQLDDGSHLEICHLGFRHLVFFSQIHS